MGAEGHNGVIADWLTWNLSVLFSLFHEMYLSTLFVGIRVEEHYMT